MQTLIIDLNYDRPRDGHRTQKAHGHTISSSLHPSAAEGTSLATACDSRQIDSASPLSPDDALTLRCINQRGRTNTICSTWTATLLCCWWGNVLSIPSPVYQRKKWSGQQFPNPFSSCYLVEKQKKTHFAPLFESNPSFRGTQNRNENCHQMLCFSRCFCRCDRERTTTKNAND